MLFCYREMFYMLVTFGAEYNHYICENIQDSYNMNKIYPSTGLATWFNQVLDLVSIYLRNILMNSHQAVNEMKWVIMYGKHLEQIIKSLSLITVVSLYRHVTVISLLYVCAFCTWHIPLISTISRDMVIFLCHNITHITEEFRLLIVR